MIAQNKRIYLAQELNQIHATFPFQRSFTKNFKKGLILIPFKLNSNNSTQFAKNTGISETETLQFNHNTKAKIQENTAQTAESADFAFCSNFLLEELKSG